LYEHKFWSNWCAGRYSGIIDINNNTCMVREPFAWKRKNINTNAVLQYKVVFDASYIFCFKHSITIAGITLSSSSEVFGLFVNIVL